MGLDDSRGSLRIHEFSQKIVNFHEFHEHSKNGDSVPASQEEKPKTASGSGVLNPPSRESSRPAGTCVGQNNEI